MAEHCGQLLLGDGVVAGEVVEVEDELGLFGHRAAAADGDADEEFFKVNLARALPVEDGEEALWRVRQNCGGRGELPPWAPRAAAGAPPIMPGSGKNFRNVSLSTVLPGERSDRSWRRACAAWAGTRPGRPVEAAIP